MLQDNKLSKKQLLVILIMGIVLFLLGWFHKKYDNYIIHFVTFFIMMESIIFAVLLDIHEPLSGKKRFYFISIDNILLINYCLAIYYAKYVGYNLIPRGIPASLLHCFVIGFILIKVNEKIAEM